MATGNRRQTVVLLHGLWMGRWAMLPLGHRLKRAGFHVRHFGYPTRAPLPRDADRLDEWLEELGAVHFVAHSLGGLVLAHLFDRHPDRLEQTDRIVLLGSPLAGSVVARRVGDTLIGRWTLNGSLERGLSGDVPAWRAPRTLMIAGTRPIGPGRLIPRTLSGPSDGTVAVTETRDPALAEHRSLPVNHFGMLLSRRVADEAIAFLQPTGAD
ncbi:esterase/lipase family protein [Guyparkeria sp.]|uniref:esterase/lipase family protein n=1 Tax=Guyparkeria sp. TaxID=2035736 RepID=UPI0035613C23